MWHALARSLLTAAVLGACARSGLDSPIDSDGDGVMLEMPEPFAEQAGVGAPEPTNPVSMVSTVPNAPPSPPAGTAWVAACAVPPLTGPIVAKECLIRIDTIDVETGKEIFHADSRESGANCNADLKLGTRVELRVDVANPRCRLETWRPGFLISDGLPCPCADTNSTSCRFVVERDVYCGAVFVMDE